MNDAGWVRLGRAATEGQAISLGEEDPIIAARAVRRALADAGRHAVDVVALAIASSAPIGQDPLARFARRALGPHGADVQQFGLEIADTDADALARHAARLLRTVRAVPGGVAIAVGLGGDGTTVALCLGPLAPPRPPAEPA